MAISSMSLFLKDISYLAYISQYDLHISEMTVRETLHFSAWC
jgi:ABC-type multidrug transport system ATPase subunit